MARGQRGPLKPQLLFHASVPQYLNVLQLAGEGDGTGGSSGLLLSADALSGYSQGIGDASNWYLDTGIYLDDGHLLDTGIYAASALAEAAAILGEGDGVGGGSGLLSGGAPLPLPEGGPYRYRTPRTPQLPPSKRIPVHIKAQPTVVEVKIPAPVEVDRQAVIAALYASGAINEEEFTALIAA